MNYTKIKSHEKSLFLEDTFFEIQQGGVKYSLLLRQPF